MQLHPITNHSTQPDMPSATNSDHDARYLNLDGEDQHVINGTFDLTTTGHFTLGDITVDSGVATETLWETTSAARHDLTGTLVRDDANPILYRGRRARVGPTSLNDGDGIFGFYTFSWDTNTSSYLRSGTLIFSADGAHGSDDIPGKFAIALVPDSSATLRDVFTIGATGNASFPDGDLSVDGDIDANFGEAANTGLILHGSGTGATARGGLVKWWPDGVTGITGYTYLNSNNLIVFDNAGQATSSDTGNAWIGVNNGFGSFAGHTFTIGATGTTKQNSITQTFSSSKVLADGTLTGIFEVAVASGQLVGGNIDYTIKVDNGTDLQCHSGNIAFVAVNKAGTVTCDAEESYLAAAEAEIKTSGTLTDAWDCLAGASKVTVRCNANTNLGDTPVLTVDYIVNLHSMNVVTIL